MSAAWHDKPTEPGLWFWMLDKRGICGCRILAKDVGDKCWEDGSRYYGPIPPDNASGVGE